MRGNDQAIARFASVDALRGITVAAMLLVNTPGDWSHIYAPLRHAEWHGCTPIDLIFPLFLFVAGVSITLATSPRLERGESVATLRRGLLARALRIIALGLLLHLAAHFLLATPTFRPWGVLQRIGICFAFAGIVALYLRTRMQWLCIIGLLVAWLFLLALGGSYEPLDNIASRVDTQLFGKYLYVFDSRTGKGQDPEGLLSTLGAFATILIGVRAGDWLRRGALYKLWLAGIAALALGAMASIWQPINKQLWTASYVLWSGGFAMFGLAICHGLIDRRGWPALGRRFGVNAIAAYAGSALMVYLLIAVGLWSKFYELGFSSWMTPLFGADFSSLVFAIVHVFMWWLIVLVMDRRGWYLRI